MKAHTSIRDNLYDVLDKLIEYCKLFNRSLPSITLTAVQYKIFQQFNVKIDGVYRYRGIEVKGL